MIMLSAVLLTLVPAACTTTTTSPTSTTDSTPAVLPDKVDVLYFHSPTRCASCI